MSYTPEICFVTGKGGVGKSTFAASLALSRSKEGKKTLLVELGTKSFYKEFFHLPQVGYRPQVWKPSLEVALWSGKECLHEYARHLLKIEKLYQLFFENAVSKALINVAPGLSEISILGKITSSHRRVGPRLDYDCLVVDAFATGHFMALLKAPQALAETVKFGPMAEQSQQIDTIIKNKNITKYFVVSLAEEMPTLEALELYQKIEKQTGIKPQIVMNKVWQMPEAVWSAHEKLKQIHDRQEKWIGQVPGAKICPQVFSHNVEEILSQMEKATL